MKDSHSFDPGSNPGTSTPILRTIVRNEPLSSRYKQYILMHKCEFNFITEHCMSDIMATVTYLNYYANGRWNRNEVRSFENNKVTLGSNDPEVDSFPQVRKSKYNRLMSYELGVPPFFLISSGKIWIDSLIEPIVETDTEIVFARVTEKGLIFIRKGKNRTKSMIMSSVSLDGNKVRRDRDQNLHFNHLRKIIPFQSFNPTPSKFHSLNDISSTNLPIGSRTLPDPIFGIELNSIGGEGLLPPIVIKEEDWRDKKNPRILEYKLNHFSKGSIKVRLLNNGRMRAQLSVINGISADSFWFTEEPILVNRETHKRRDD